MKRIFPFLTLFPGLFALIDLFLTHGGFQGIKNWIFPTGLVAILLLLLGVRVVVLHFKSTNMT
ncbi:MAG: hypothetical protein QM627_03420 [Luteolibacter sp.]